MHHYTFDESDFLIGFYSGHVIDKAFSDTFEATITCQFKEKQADGKYAVFCRSNLFKGNVTYRKSVEAIAQLHNLPLPHQVLASNDLPGTES